MVWPDRRAHRDAQYYRQSAQEPPEDDIMVHDYNSKGHEEDDSYALGPSTRARAAPNDIREARENGDEYQSVKLAKTARGHRKLISSIGALPVNARLLGERTLMSANVRSPFGRE